MSQIPTVSYPFAQVRPFAQRPILQVISALTMLVFSLTPHALASDTQSRIDDTTHSETWADASEDSLALSNGDEFPLDLLKTPDLDFGLYYSEESPYPYRFFKDIPLEFGGHWTFNCSLHWGQIRFRLPPEIDAVFIAQTYAVLEHQIALALDTSAGPQGPHYGCLVSTTDTDGYWQTSSDGRELIYNYEYEVCCFIIL